MKTAKEYWKEKFDEYPQNDSEKLAVAMMQEYAQEVVKNNAVLPNVSGSLPVEDVVKAINDEPELPGEMPDEIYQAVKNDKDALTELVRITVRETKKGILERLGQ